MRYITVECIFWLYGSFFSGDDRDILKEEVKTYLKSLTLHLIETLDLFLHHP